MKKELPFEIAQIGYFPADMLALSILNTYCDTDAILYGFYNLFGNFCFHSNGNITLNAELNWECPLLSRKFVPRAILAEIEGFSLIKFIESCVNNNFYIYITVDESRMKYYADCGDSFSPHPITIYGYDSLKKCFYMADFFDEWKYKKEEITYDELIDANESIHKNMGVLDAFSGSNEWIFDIELVKYLHNYDMIYNIDYISYSIDMFLQGRGIGGNVSSLHRRLQPQIGLNPDGSTGYYEAKISDEFFGINVLKNIVNHIERCENCSKNIFNFRHVYLILEYAKLMRIKFAKLCQSDYIGEKVGFDEILTKIDIVEQDISLALNLSLKYSYTHRADDLKKIAKYVRTSVEQIEEINYMALSLLKDIK